MPVRSLVPSCRTVGDPVLEHDVDWHYRGQVKQEIVRNSVPFLPMARIVDGRCVGHLA